MHQFFTGIRRAATHELRIQPGRALVVEDDPGIRQAIVSCLAENHCPTVSAPSHGDIAREAASGRYGLVVLGVRPGDRDRFDSLRRIRMLSDIPIVMIADERHDEIDRIVGLELGADDYLARPFNPRELLARARAILRRQEMGRQANSPVARGGYRFNGWELRRRTRTLTDPGGIAVPLTKSEYGLLAAFLAAPGRPLSRGHLLQATRTHEDIFDRSIDVQVLRLRRKLEDDPSRPDMILTRRGVGYVFAAEVQALF